VFADVVTLWEQVLGDLEIDQLRTADRLDWTAKLRLLEGFIARDGLEWNDPKLRLLDLQYHDVDPARGLHRRLVERGLMRRLFSDEEVARAAEEPPHRTRAFFRGRCVAQFPEALVAANWDSLVFDIGEETLKRLPMMEPLRGDEARVGELLARAEDAIALVRAIGGGDG
ncbi:MAG TPA: proteasome accessory factor PafA2 family protein, partial [Acidimicrobiia bacterium]